MIRLLSLTTFFSILTLWATAQKFNPSINKDSLLKVIYQKLGSDERIKEFKTHYNSGNKEVQEFLLFMGSMPQSSKKELIANIDNNYDKIHLLIESFRKLVPKGFDVFIEFQPANNIITTPANIDMRIEYLNPDNFNSEEIDQKWKMEYGSAELDRMCKKLKWNDGTLKEIKQLLDDAHCISIDNNAIAGVGFARSGMGKYSYRIFNHNLDTEEIGKYNDGCSYIFHKNNIVLQYGGGAVGPQCFPNGVD